MDKNIEVEVRGILNKEQLEKLSKLLETKGRFKTNKERLMIDYSMFLPDGGVRNRSKDIRLRVTNGKPEVILKLGKWGSGEKRKEISVMTEEGSFDRMVEIFASLGLSKGALCVRKSKVYDYEGIEFAIVEVPNHSYYFEAEKMAHHEEDLDKVYDELENFCRSLGLSPFTDEEFMQYIEQLNKEANINFDFKDHTPQYFKQFDLKI